MKNKAGFTLVEMAIVLIIVGLLVSALLAPLGAQRDLKDYSEVKTNLEQIKEALYGYALSHIALDGRPHFPCPDTDGNGSENRTGAVCTSAEGTLPTQELGLVGTDSWNNNFDYRVSLVFSNNTVGFTLGTLGDITVLDASGGNTIVANIPALVMSRGKNGGVAAVSANEIENTDLDSTFVNAESNTTFDDVVVWASPNVLFNRMVTAGRLP